MHAPFGSKNPNGIEIENETNHSAVVSSPNTTQTTPTVSYFKCIKQTDQNLIYWNISQTSLVTSHF